MKELATPNDCLRDSLLPPVMVLLARSIGPYKLGQLLELVGTMTFETNIESSLVERRSRDGGLRIGEMERDAICAHGLSQFLKERMVDNSDIYTMYVCDICGLQAHKVPDKKYYTCHSCQNTTKISKIIAPYAFKLFLQELGSINILARIRTSKSIVTPRG